MRRLLILPLLLSLLWVAAPAASAAAPAAPAAPYCGIEWGSTVKSVSSYSSAPLKGVRAGRHSCYDRLVLDFSGDVKGYRVEYVSTASAPGSGARVRLRGAGDLQITALSPAYTSDGRATFAPRSRSEVVNVSGYHTFRQVAYLGSFEGSSSLGLGVRARLPFRVLLLDGPGSSSRLVVDVAHRW